MLLAERKIGELFPHFPTRWQAVIFRNYGIVSSEKLAEVLCTDVAVIEAEAERLGLGKIKYNPLWLKEGYITVIKSNWHLLPYGQLLQLIGFTEKQLGETLFENDFLAVKLGNFKPEVTAVRYEALTDGQIKRTKEIRGIIEKYIPEFEMPYFKFTESFGKSIYENPDIEIEFDKTDKRLCGYVEFVKTNYDLSHLSGKKILLRKDDGNPLLDGEKFYYNANDNKSGIAITAGAPEGFLRAMQLLAENEILESGRLYAPALEKRIIYSYCAPCGDTLFDGNTGYEDGLLREYAKLKINGIWIHGLLSKLTVFPFDESLSEGYKTRIKNLNALIERAGRYGIKVYLYLNEPRGLPLSFFDAHPELLGSTEESMGALCTARQEVKDYIYTGVKSLTTDCPALGGIITITMSENLTNCYSRVNNAKMNCPVCAHRNKEDIVAEVNNLMMRAVRDSGSTADVIAWMWGWDAGLNWTQADIEKALGLLDKDIIVMCTSEDHLAINKNGVSGVVIDYSISNVGPSEKTKKAFEYCRNNSKKFMAKIQAGNSWECSAVPFIPVPELIERHADNLLSEGVSGLMLSWTLGGYPGQNIEIISKKLFNGKFSLASYASDKYGANGEMILQAFNIFSDAFSQLPFSLSLLYLGPQNCGAANLFFESDTGLKASMVGYPYDDLTGWRANYTEQQFLQQFQALVDRWEEGLNILTAATADGLLLDSAAAFFCHMKSTLLQIKYILQRDNNKTPPSQKTKNLAAIIAEEYENTVTLIEIIKREPTIGYESSNQYYYNLNLLLEKLLNLEYLKTNL